MNLLIFFPFSGVNYGTAVAHTEGGKVYTCAAILYIRISWVARRTLATISHKYFPVGHVLAITVYTAACIFTSIPVLSLFTWWICNCPLYNNVIIHRKIKFVFHRAVDVPSSNFAGLGCYYFFPEACIVLHVANRESPVFYWQTSHVIQCICCAKLKSVSFAAVQLSRNLSFPKQSSSSLKGKGMGMLPHDLRQCSLGLGL